VSLVFVSDVIKDASMGVGGGAEGMELLDWVAGSSVELSIRREARDFVPLRM